MLPTTTPVQFEPDALHATIDRMLSLPAASASSRRTSARSPTSSGSARDLHAAIVELVRIARLHAAAPDRRARIEADMFRYFSAQLDEHGYAGDLARRHALLDADVRLKPPGSRSGWTEGTRIAIVNPAAAGRASPRPPHHASATRLP